MIGKTETKEYKAATYLIENNNLQIIALHKDMANELNNLFGIQNTYVVNNGIELERFENANPDRMTYRTKLGIAKDAFVLGHVGRFAEQKNHLFLINIFEAVLRVRENAHLLLIGTGILEDRVRSYLKSKGLDKCTTILTHRSDVPELMKLMDVFVFPSKYEGLGIVLIEAQAAKLKCVISDTVPKQAIVSNIVSVVSLRDPIEMWRDSILLEKSDVFKADFSEWDIVDVVRRLEGIYG